MKSNKTNLSKIFFGIIAFFLISCGTLSNSNKSLLYDLPNDKAKELITNEIDILKSVKKNVFFIFGKNQNGFKIQIVPTSDLNDNIQNLKIVNSNRMLLLGDKKYIVVFDYDYEFGAAFKNETVEGIVVNAKRKKMYLYDYATTLFFDDNWSFIKKESLLKKL
ncbi:hypothetical protein B4N84_21230 [Flavobacterium sp. IR1]|nr:hypothetical protein B4N84_21230 [Flavobacterium sp. IR1]